MGSPSFEVLTETWAAGVSGGALGPEREDRHFRGVGWILSSRSRVLDLCTGMQEPWVLLMARVLPSGWGESSAPGRGSFSTEPFSCFPGHLGASAQDLLGVCVELTGLTWLWACFLGRAIRPALGPLSGPHGVST